MAEDIDKSGEAAKTPESAPANAEIKSELPVVASPPLSPAGAEPAVAPEPQIAPQVETIASPAEDSEALPQPAAARFHLRPRHKRHVALAASVTLAAALGAIIGALATAPGAPPANSAGERERQAMQQTIGKLSQDIATLQASIKTTNKSARTQVAKISERLNDPPTPVPQEPQTTGSIPLPPAAIPTPVPRPQPRLGLVHDWSIRDVRDGYVYVQGHGDIYQVVLGAQLPGLGPVQQIKRQDGRWVVATPKGLIVAQRDRRHFEPN